MTKLEKINELNAKVLAQAEVVNLLTVQLGNSMQKQQELLMEMSKLYVEAYEEVQGRTKLN
jgi:hypothetical protein